MTRTRKGTVYALIDPRDNKIRYIGKTEKPILARLAHHLATPTNPAMRVWINALSLQGLTPRIEAVATVPVDGLGAEEQRQIKRHADDGHRLLNAPYYHQHIGDLGQRPTKATGPGGVPDKKLARRAYGRLAAARVLGRIPGWSVALAVTVTAPVYTAVLILRALLGLLLNTKAGIRVTLLALVGWVLWDAGFDAAVRDLLLPRLPLGQSAALWHGYMAAPLAELAAGLSVPLAAMSVLVAAMSYEEIAKAAGTKRG